MEGGERRLNVAVTRARQHMTVVSSFRSSEIDPARSSARGVLLLKDYLRYAETHGSDLGDSRLAPPPLNPFEIQVRDALVAAGLKVKPQHGASGYRIDFAVEHPDRPGAYVLAIECDGASYHSSPTARDRDRLRQQHLERLDWRFHRIWSGDWFGNRERALKAALATYRDALATYDQKLVDKARAKVAQSAPTPTAKAAPVVPPNPSSPPRLTVVAAPRRGPRPNITKGLPIDAYALSQLVTMVDWIESDTLLRTEDEVLGILMQELGFQRRGAKIVAALSAAIKSSRARRRKTG
jgi:very-short-patch-repair endonuclease